MSTTETTAIPGEPSAGEITRLLQRCAGGDTAAGGQLLSLVYQQLHALAAAKMRREAPGHTLQATALVHEAWLRLGGDEQPAWRDRHHFFGAAAEAMRRILVESARRKQARRHGGGQVRVDADDPQLGLVAPDTPAEILAVHDALDRLAAHDARKAEIVKLHYFAGLTLTEAGQVLGISEPTAKRDWAYARSWLYREYQP